MWKPCKKWRDNLLIKRVSESLSFVCLHRYMSHPSLGISLVLVGFFLVLFFVFVSCVHFSRCFLLERRAVKTVLRSDSDVA